ncbi:penicillin-binding protein, partial [Patescibacteria group bacterium]|nr:penicillin-binding protein [Patescibacteria group bacterium]
MHKWNLNWAKIFLVGSISGVVLLVGMFFWYSRGLPDPANVLRKTGFSSVILDREGEEILFDVYTDENRKFTPLEEIPEYLKQATVAVEDKDFYNHQGFDLMGMLRGFSRFFTRGRAQGGSTLTQQLVKNVLLTTERRVSRKIREFVLSVRIESRFEKDEILQMYLNEAPYGGTAWGVAAASEMYFGKEVADLDLAESVILAGLPQAPTTYSPYNASKSYLDRAKQVARRMREDGYIDEETEKELIESLEGVEFRPVGTSIKAPHFVMEVRAILEEMFGAQILERGGLKVTTTLDWELQKRAQDIVAEEIDKVAKSLSISNGASVIIDVNSGDVLSMVGSRDFFDTNIDGEVNVVTRLRQPGSSIKPVVYATAFSKGFTPASVLMDTITEFPGKDENTPYIPKNYDGEEHGPLHLRDALA